MDLAIFIHSMKVKTFTATFVRPRPIYCQARATIFGLKAKDYIVLVVVVCCGVRCLIYYHQKLQCLEKFVSNDRYFKMYVTKKN